MVDGVLIVSALFAAYLGFAALALASNRPWHRIAGSRPHPHGARRLLIGASIAFWTASLVLILLRDGPAFGALLWLMQMSLAGFLVVASVTWRPVLLTSATLVLFDLACLRAGRSPDDRSDATALDRIRPSTTGHGPTHGDR